MALAGTVTEKAPRSARGRSLRLLAGLLILAVVAAEFIAFVKRPDSEFPVYLRAAQRMDQGEAVYCLEPPAFTYPPLFAVVFEPFVYLPEETHLALWFLVNLAALAVIFWRLRCRLLPAMQAAADDGPRWRRLRPWLFGLALVALYARHLRSALEYQSHDILIFLCVTLTVDALCGVKQGAAGLFAGLGAGLKATPLLFAPLFLWQRRFRALAVMLAVLVFCLFVPDLLFPASDGRSWVVTWYDTFVSNVRPGESASTAKAWNSWNHLNQGLAGSLHRLFHAAPAEPDDWRYLESCLVALEPAVLKVVTFMAQMTVVVWLAWITRPSLTMRLPESQRAFQRLGEGGAVATAMLLLSPMSSKAHFCTLLLPLTFCLVDFLYRRRAVLVGASLLLALLLGTLSVKGIAGRDAGDHFLARGSVTWCAVAILAATGCALLGRSRHLRAVAGSDADQDIVVQTVRVRVEEPERSTARGVSAAAQTAD